MAGRPEARTARDAADIVARLGRLNHVGVRRPHVCLILLGARPRQAQRDAAAGPRRPASSVAALCDIIFR